jgi:hypothetical protein
VSIGLCTENGFRYQSVVHRMSIATQQ